MEQQSVSNNEKNINEEDFQTTSETKKKKTQKTTPSVSHHCVTRKRRTAAETEKNKEDDLLKELEAELNLRKEGMEFEEYTKSTNSFKLQNKETKGEPQKIANVSKANQQEASSALNSNYSLWGGPNNFR